VSFFLKVLTGETGKNMVQSEFASVKAILAVVPDFVLNPIAWGTYQSTPHNHFFMAKFHKLKPDPPVPIDAFVTRLVTLHGKSKSLTGKFGFDMTTYAGNLSQMTGWEDSWGTFFSKSLQHAF